MPYINNSEIVKLPVKKIYEAFADVDKYPQIVDYIKAVKILKKADDTEIVRLKLGIDILNFSYDCLIEYTPLELIKITQVKGPFSYLNSLIEFEAISESETKVSYTLDCKLKLEFMEFIVEKLFSAQFKRSIKMFEKYVLALQKQQT